MYAVTAQALSGERLSGFHHGMVTTIIVMEFLGSAVTGQAFRVRPEHAQVIAWNNNPSGGWLADMTPGGPAVLVFAIDRAPLGSETFPSITVAGTYILPNKPGRPGQAVSDSGLSLIWVGHLPHCWRGWGAFVGGPGGKACLITPFHQPHRRAFRPGTRKNRPRARPD